MRKLTEVWSNFTRKITKTPPPPPIASVEVKQPEARTFRQATLEEVTKKNDSFLRKAVKQGCIFYPEIDQFQLQSYDKKTETWTDAIPPYPRVAYAQIYSRLKSAIESDIWKREVTISIQTGSANSVHGPFRIKTSQ